MLSGGDPSTGTAGYVAIELFEGIIDGRTGTILFQQFGSMVGGAEVLRYEVIPGSGTGELATVTGELVLDAANDDHKVMLRLRLTQLGLGGLPRRGAAPLDIPSERLVPAPDAS